MKALVGNPCELCPLCKQYDMVQSIIDLYLTWHMSRENSLFPTGTATFAQQQLPTIDMISANHGFYILAIDHIHSAQTIVSYM